MYDAVPQVVGREFFVRPSCFAFLNGVGDDEDVVGGDDVAQDREGRRLTPMHVSCTFFFLTALRLMILSC